MVKPKDDAIESVRNLLADNKKENTITKSSAGIENGCLRCVIRHI